MEHLPDPRAVLIQSGGRDEGRNREGTTSASLGTMVQLVRKLDMLLAPQGRSSKRVKDAIRLLKADVEELSTYLHELSEVEDPPPTAMCWMNEARDLSYDMEDYIGNLHKTLEDPSLVVKTTRALRKLTSHGKTPKRLVRTVSEFRVYVQDAIQRREVYGLSDSGPGSLSTLRRRFVSVGPMLQTPYEETAEIVIDGRMNEFITSLSKDGDQQLKVVSVFGSACLGKTTLAIVCYNIFGKQYNCRAFIRVSRKADMKRIFHDMLWQLQGQHPPKDCKEIDLIDNIKKYLQDKRYLIIIDDLWTASEWNIINQAFPNGSHASRIITTTQIEDVALTCCRYQSEHVFEMKPLDEDHSRKLFFNRLFGSESYCPQQLKEILTEIVEICGGLPLATVSIASLLASHPVITVDLLTYIYQSLCSFFSANSTSEIMRQVLNFIYNNLPHHLKTCLLYVSMYPKGRTFYQDDLVKQWMAEGFIETTKWRDAKKFAESYLHQLIGRRFIQPTSINYNDEVVSCVVHDAVHDLIAQKSVEENFIVVIDYNQMNVALSRKVRRLSLLFGDAIYAKTPANITKTQVRSLTFFGFHECIPCITEFKLLCVLNIQLSDHGGHHDPVDLAGISELFQLRYLKIASDICIKLPKHGLQCLETLDIRDARVAVDGVGPCVPYIHLPHLLHLSLSGQIKLLNWVNDLVSDGKLNYLQDIHITTPTYDSFGMESVMETLAFIIRSCHHKLKTIVVRADSSVKKAVVRGAYEVANFRGWNDVILPPLLERFEFVTHNRVFFSRIPSLFTKHGNLCILKIELMDLKTSCVDVFRGLPALTTLSLYVHTAPCQRIMFDKSGFSVLKYFKLRFTSGIAWLKFEADAMANLWKLKLVFDAIPRMDQHSALFSNSPLFKNHQRGTAVIRIDHMPGLKEISVKFGGAAADVQYALRTGVSNHPSNPTINKQPVHYRFYSEERSKLKQQQSDEILVEGLDEYNQKQPDEYYYKQEPDKILEEETDEDYKQSDKILEEEPNEYDKTLEGSDGTRISSSPESFPRLHVPGPASLVEKLLGRGAGMAFKRRLGCFGWDQEKAPRQRRKEKPKQLITTIMQEREDRLQWLRDNQQIGAQPTWLANVGVHVFTIDALTSATRNFSTFLGGHHRVYNVSANVLTPQRVVVINLGLSYDKTSRWLEEAAYLETKKHPNIVKLVGFCNEYPYRMLVYEHVPRGSLQYYLVNNLLGRISWLKRLKIAIGAAQGLAFLYESGTLVDHSGDFKASKILLDSDYTAKLSGSFLQARDPCIGWNINDEVYNLGVVLLELLIGQPSINKQGHGYGEFLVEEMLSRLQSKDELQRIMDKSLMGRYSMTAAWSMATIVQRCCSARHLENRPSMREIVEDLEDIARREQAGVPSKKTKQAGGKGKQRGKPKQP